MVAGDTLVAVALAGSLFFSLEPDAARGRVMLYLLLTMAPFAVVAPLIGPAMDRAAGGRRLMVIASGVFRSALCLFMIDDIDGLLLFPEAFAVLVLAKGYSVAKSALVPGLVRDESALVEANSKLTLVSGIVGFAAGLPAAGVLNLFGAEWVLGLAMIVFALGAVSGVRLPRVGPPASVGEAERAELHSAGILLAASAMALVRAIVGFLTFLIAFGFRGADAPAWQFGAVLAASAAGTLAGAAVAPPLRRYVREEYLLAGSIAGLAGAVTLALLLDLGRVVAAALVGAAVGLAASAGKQAFDAIVQRDAPDADKARSFARFETRFQIVWVAGAFLPVLLSIPLTAGYVVIGTAAALCALSYVTALQAARRHPQRARRSVVEPLTTRVPENWTWARLSERARKWVPTRVRERIPGRRRP